MIGSMLTLCSSYMHYNTFKYDLLQVFSSNTTDSKVSVLEASSSSMTTTVCMRTTGIASRSQQRSTFIHFK